MTLSDQITGIDPVETAEILECIPHRFPFLFIDRVKDIVPYERAVGVKAISAGEGFFQGHFPGHPIMPGVLIVEAMAQTAAVLVVKSLGLENEGKLVYFMSLDEAKFRKPVYPGVLLELNIVASQRRGRVWKFRGEGRVEGTLVAEASFAAMIRDPE